MKRSSITLRRVAVVAVVTMFVSCPATTATAVVGGLPPSEFADTEIATNAVVRISPLARTFTGEIALFATQSNAVEVAFGTADGDGVLLPGEEDFGVGWECGSWFVSTRTERVRSAPVQEPVRRALSFSLRVSASGKPVAVSFSAQGADPEFSSTFAAPGNWAFSHDWNAVRLVVRGVDLADESAMVRFSADPDVLLVR